MSNTITVRGEDRGCGSWVAVESDGHGRQVISIPHRIRSRHGGSMRGACLNWLLQATGCPAGCQWGRTVGIQERRRRHCQRGAVHGVKRRCRPSHCLGPGGQRRRWGRWLVHGCRRRGRSQHQSPSIDVSRAELRLRQHADPCSRIGNRMADRDVWHALGRNGFFALEDRRALVGQDITRQRSQYGHTTNQHGQANHESQGLHTSLHGQAPPQATMPPISGAGGSLRP
jgi:hypothetical protein